MRATIPILLAAALGVLLREAAPDAWVLPLPLRLLLLALLAGAIVLELRAWRRHGAGSPWVLIGLTLTIAAAALRLAPVHPGAEDWQRHEEQRLRDRHARVQAAVLDLETMARTVAERAAALPADSATAAPDSAQARAHLFDALSELLQRESRAHAGLENLGVQVFDARGDLLAWAGAPHAREAGTRLTHFAGAGRNVYFRRSGVYTLLSYEQPLPRGEPAVEPSPAAADSVAAPARAARRARVLVDVPVEVHYQLNNRFLQSHSLPEELSGDGVEVDFIYDATALPAYLTHGDLEILGDPQRGLLGQAVVRDSQGLPLSLCRLTSLPYTDAVERAAARLDAAARWLLVLAAAAGCLAIAAGLRRARRRLVRALIPLWPVVSLWGLRLLLAQLALPSSTLRSNILNPATFAMVGFGGMLRSPLDLLLTALTLALCAAVVFLHAVRRQSGRGAAPSASAARHARGAVAALLAAAVVVLALRLAFGFVGRVAADSNPILIGAQLDLLSPAVLCLHAALLLGVAAWLCLALVAVSGLLGSSRGAWPPAAGAALAASLLWFTTTPLTALVGLGVLLAGARLHRLLDDQRFTSFALASLTLAALTATLDSDAIHREYFRTKQMLVQERAAEILDPDDDMRRVVLEEVLGKLDEDAGIETSLRAERGADRGALAFRVWAQSMLSHLGYSCQVRVFDVFGQQVSDFSVDMPLARDVSVRELLARVHSDSLATMQTDVEVSASGKVRVYSGAVAVRSPAPRGAYRGAVVIDLPFAHQSLDLAANPRARTPEVLRNLQEEGIGPRVEDAERLLLAWLEHGFVVESSTPYLEVGQALHQIETGGGGDWQRLQLVNGVYLVKRVPAGSRVLLAGFRLSSPLDRLLDEWTQMGSFGFAATMILLLLFLVLTRATDLGRSLPPLLVPKRLGFQQKLMMAFLVVSLLPSVVLSVATRDIMRDRSLSRNRDAALAKARSAEAALADLVRRDLEAVRESEYLRAVITSPWEPPARDIGHLEFSQIMVFRADGSIILDETLSNLSDEQAREFVQHAPSEVFASRDGRYLYLGALVEIWYSPAEILNESAPDAQPYWLYYRRRMTDTLLRNLAPILNADISGFLGAQLAVSSQKSLAIAGLMPSLVPPQAFTHLQLRRNRYAVVEEHTGRQRYFTGYLPLEDSGGRRIGSLAVSQLLQPDEFAVEVERTRALVLGLSTLMFALTLVLGVVFATRIFDPVRSLIDGTRRIAGGDLSFRLRARSGDEIGELERSFNDMAARQQEARWALEERRRYLEAVLGHIASGVMATDNEGRITAANPAAYRILGWQGSSLEGRLWQDPGLVASGMAHFWSHLSEAPDGEVVEIPMLRGAGAAPVPERLTLRVVVTDLLPPGGETRERLGRVAIFEDVTELIRSKKLSAWAEMARQVAHEIKNPLTPMKLSAQFVEQAFRDESPRFPQIFRESMKTIIEQIESLRRIATEFSSFGRAQKLEPRALDLGELLQRVTAPYRSIEGLDLEVLDGGEGAARATAPPGAQPAGERFPGSGVRVLGDEDGLRKVFVNVLENAREAMNGKGRISLRVLPPAGGRVQVQIADTGNGLSDEAASRLFEPYFSTKSTGTGLGLAITRGILEELGGSVTLHNLPNGGAETRITLVLC